MKLFKNKINNSQKRLSGENPNSARPVFSYYARGDNRSANKGIRTTIAGNNSSRRPKINWKHVPTYLALMVIVTALTYSLYLQSNPKITIIASPDSVHRQSKDYQEATQKIWEKSIFNRSKLTINSSKISKEIEDQFAEVADVKIELQLLGHRPTITITPDIPAIQIISANGSFYINARGKVLAKSSEVIVTPSPNLFTVRDESGILAEVGNELVSSQQVAYLKNLYFQLSAENLKVVNIILPPKAANEADVYIEGQKYFIKFNIISDPRQAVGAYQSVMIKLANENIVPQEYVDTRVEEKVYYR